MMNEKNEMRANGTAVNVGISVCPGCGRHCPVDALSCGRGMNIVRRLAAGDTLEQIREDARKEHGGKLEGDEDSLMGLLRTCGHYLYHHSGQSRTQDRVLRLLSERGELSQKELREVLNTKPGSISELISKLEAKGLIASQRDETDRRQVNLWLTEDGRERAAMLAEDNEEEATFDALTSEEQETLKALLKKLADSWR